MQNMCLPDGPVAATAGRFWFHEVAMTLWHEQHLSNAVQFCPTIQRCCMTLPQHLNYTQILCFITPNTSSKLDTIITTMFFQSKILLEDRMRELIAKLILLLGWSHLSNTPLLQRSPSSSRMKMKVGRSKICNCCTNGLRLNASSILAIAQQAAANMPWGQP